MSILSDLRTTTKCCALNIHKRYFLILRGNPKFWATARGIYWVAVIAVVCVSYEIWSPLLLTSQIQLPRGPKGWCVWVSANQASSWSWGFREDCYFTHFVLWRSIDRGKFYQSRDMRHWQLIRSKLGFYFSSGIMADIDVFFVGALLIDQSKIKHTKQLKEIPSKHVLENLLEKS